MCTLVGIPFFNEKTNLIKLTNELPDELFQRNMDIVFFDDGSIDGSVELLSVIEEPPVIKRILDQIGEWCPSPPPRAPPAEQEWPKGCQIPLSYHPVPDIA